MTKLRVPDQALLSECDTDLSQWRSLVFMGRTREKLLAVPRDKCVLVVCHHCDGSSERGNLGRGSVAVLGGFSEELRQVLKDKVHSDCQSKKKYSNFFFFLISQRKDTKVAGMQRLSVGLGN